eukprot:TRINITY_DN4958_c0_g1_i4.p1 TRINITY_DN4958_c0_g1~~TRINITY_DN4958_c0_g1_i4.p1  ORF type:complete len:796 (-),score=217.56 TRINITY_DN4958_c0_g1_i4:174-2561(-)
MSTSNDRSSEVEDDSFQKFNYAVGLFFSCKLNRALEVLKELHDNRDNLPDYLVFKLLVLLAEMATIYKDFSKHLDILKNLNWSKSFLGNNLDNVTDHEDLTPGSSTMLQHSKSETRTKESMGFSDLNSSFDSSRANATPSSHGKLISFSGKDNKQPNYYNPLLIGTEVYRHDENPSNCCQQEIQFIFSIICVQSQIMLGDYAHAKKNLKQCHRNLEAFMSVIQNSQMHSSNTMSGSLAQTFNEKIYHPSIAGLVAKQSILIFKYTKAYLAYHTKNFRKCIKHLANIPKDIKELSQMSIEGPELNHISHIYQLNNLACCHLKLGKHNLAIFYLNKALNIAQKINNNRDNIPPRIDGLIKANAAQKFPLVVYNLGIAMYSAGKFSEAIDPLTSSYEFFGTNPKVWYRLGVCYLNRYHQILRDNSSMKRNNLYNEYLDAGNPQPFPEDEAKTTDTRATKGKNSKVEEPPESQRDSFNFKRYVLNVRDSLVYSHDDDGTQSVGGILSSNANTNNSMNAPAAGLNISKEKQLEANVDLAIKCFRNAVIILKETQSAVPDPQIEEKIIMLIEKEIHDNKSSDERQDERSDEDSNNTRDNPRGIDQNHKVRQMREDLQQSTLTHLAYAHLCRGELNNTLSTAKEALNLLYISEENKFNCLMYMCEAYCIQGKVQEASQLIQAYNIGNANPTTQIKGRNILGYNQTHFMNNVSTKTIYYTNIAAVHLANNSYAPAQNALNIALATLDINPNNLNANIPLPILNIMIYLSLVNEHSALALQLIKRRRHLTTATNNNKPLLRISK